MKSIKVCEYSRSRSFHYDLILQDQASGERSQDQWSSGYFVAGTTERMSRDQNIDTCHRTVKIKWIFIDFGMDMEF